MTYHSINRVTHVGIESEHFKSMKFNPPQLKTVYSNKNKGEKKEILKKSKMRIHDYNQQIQ